MSALLGPDASALVRPFAAVSVPAEAQGSDGAPAVDARDLELDALRETVAQLTQMLADAEQSHDRAVEEARIAGRREGLAAASDDEEARVVALRDGIDAAIDAFRGRLDLLDHLAPQLARAAIGKLFAGAESWTEVTQAALARQLGVLRRDSVVAIFVSPHDFADAAALGALATSLDAGALRIELDPQLRGGACRIACRLGQIDLDAREQWDALAGLLDAMASEARG